MYPASRSWCVIFFLSTRCRCTLRILGYVALFLYNLKPAYAKAIILVSSKSHCKINNNNNNNYHRDHSVQQKEFLVGVHNLYFLHHTISFLFWIDTWAGVCKIHQDVVVRGAYMPEGEAKSVNLGIVPISLNSQTGAAQHLICWECGWNESICINSCLSLLIH